MNFPLYASLVLLAIGLVMVAAFFVIGILEGPVTDKDDPDWEDGEP